MIGSPSASNLFSASPVATVPASLSERKIDSSASSIDPDRSIVNSILIRSPFRSEMTGRMTSSATRNPYESVNVKG